MSQDIRNDAANIVMHPMIPFGTLTKQNYCAPMLSRLFDNSQGRIAYLHHFGFRVTTCFLRYNECFSKECFGQLSFLLERGGQGQCPWHFNERDQMNPAFRFFC